MGQIKLIIPISVLFFWFTAFGDSACTLLEKNVEQRKYSFKCNNQTVNVQCENKNKLLCGVTIKGTLKSMRFELSEDEFKSFNLFSSEDLRKVECDAKTSNCVNNLNVCKKYGNFFEKTRKKLAIDIASVGHCDSVLGKTVQNLGAFSVGMVSEVDFFKNNCGDSSNVQMQAFQEKISIFKANFNLPYLDSDSLFFRCVQKEGELNKSTEQMILTKARVLDKLKSMIVSKMESSTQIKNLACAEGSEALYKDGKLDIDNVMCALVEKSVVELGDHVVRCDKVGSSMHTDRFSDGNDYRQAASDTAKADTVPLESKPMPEVMTSQVGKPIGLTPALAQVDQAVPGSGTAQGVAPSEGNIATGAVRTISASAAMQAGQAFAPVYEKLSNMASSVSSSGRTSVIGRSNSPKINTDASGVVTVSRKLPSSDSRASVDPDALVAAAGSSGGAIANNIDGDSNKASKAAGLQRSIANNTDEVAPVGGPRPISLSSSRSAGGGPGKAAANVASGAANTEAVSSAALAAVQQKITELTTPAKIETFFKKEASNIADLRNLLYSDATSKLLAAKGIRVVNQSGDVSGESMTKAKYVYSDDGTKFTKLNIGKKN